MHYFFNLSYCIILTITHRWMVPAQIVWPLSVNREQKLLKRGTKRKLVIDISQLMCVRPYFLFPVIINLNNRNVLCLIISAKEQKKTEARKWYDGSDSGQAFSFSTELVMCCGSHINIVMQLLASCNCEIRYFLLVTSFDHVQRFCFSRGNRIKNTYGSVILLIYFSMLEVYCACLLVLLWSFKPILYYIYTRSVFSFIFSYFNSPYSLTHSLCHLLEIIL